ncbi:MAG: hypothetical protein ACXWT4_17310 [Methylobacter sp.]
MVFARPPLHVFIGQTAEQNGAGLNAFGFVFLGIQNSTITPSTSILLAFKCFGFDAFTGFGKNGAITDFAVF